MAAAAASRKLIKAPGLAAADFGPGSAAGDDDPVPWDVVEQKLTELVRFVASAVQVVVAALQEHAASLFSALGSLARVALPAVAAVAVLLIVCCCVAAAQQRSRGADGGKVDDGLGGDGPVVTYRGVYKGGIFSMHPNKPIVC